MYDASMSKLSTGVDVETDDEDVVSFEVSVLWGKAV